MFGNMVLWKNDNKICRRFWQMWRKLNNGMLHDIKVAEVCGGTVNGICLLEKSW